MINDPDEERPKDDMGEPENVLKEFDQIQKRLGEGFDGDPRLASGVPQEQRGSDVEFIQMSGLVRPTAPSDNVLPPPAQDDLDSTRPVSFFEKGVADVDADMVPGLVEDRANANDDTGPIQQSQAAMSHLRDIIDDLTKDRAAASTDPALMAALDTPKPADLAPAELPPVEPAAMPEPVSLEEMLSEFVPVHPMQHESPAMPVPTETAPTPIEASAPIEPARETPAETVHVAAPTPEVPHLTRQAPVLPGHSAQLAEAEKLLDELEPVTATRFEASPDAEGPAQMDIRARAEEADALPDEALDYKQHSKRRHRSAAKNQFVRSLVRLAAALLVVSTLAVATYAGYLWMQQRMASAGQLYSQASRHLAKGDYAAASRMFDNFASLHPNDALRADAQFNAAFVMQLQKPSDNDKAQDITMNALRLFEQYRKDNPTHPKVARAEALMGRLNYESGRYAEAIELLRSPELRLRDPASTLPTLRTLARASAKMGDAEAARSYYLQAVGAQGNHSPDVDYAELGSLYQSRADHAEDLDKRIELQQLAIDCWSHALEVPGIDPSSKQTIRSQLDVLRERLQSEPGMAPAMESLDDAPPSVDESHAAAMEEQLPAAPEAHIAPTAETSVSTPDAHPPAESATPAAPERDESHAASEPASSDDGQYTVRHGDTLKSIAEAHHVTPEELKELNGLSGDKVIEGQHVIVPVEKP